MCLFGNFWEKNSKIHKEEHTGHSLVVQWLGLHTSTARGTGLISGQGTKVPQTVQRGQKKHTHQQLF